ncbi:MAG: RHS repeat domain-containing protein [Dysgonomonas sp.]|nr:RHS repeat domain-containing protein [Dysgonomonas sp.]
MAKSLLCVLLSFFITGFSLQAQTKKLLTSVNSIESKETIELKYNGKNQLVYLSEKGVIIFREFSFKYDKVTNQLTEAKMDQDRGDIVYNSKFTHTSGFVTEDLKKSGRQYPEKEDEQNQLDIDAKGNLIDTKFDDGSVWDKFSYDANGNLSKYIIHSASGTPIYVADYTYGNIISPFAGISDFPQWFWAMYVNNMKWCRDFIGPNSPDSLLLDDPRFGEDDIKITYELDADGYPVKQFYNDVLVREFTYTPAKK